MTAAEEFLTGLTEYESPEDQMRRDTEIEQLLIRGVTPGALLEAMEEPEVFQEISRADLYVHMAHMRRLAGDPSFSVKNRLEYIKELARMGKVADPEHETAGTGSLPMINITLPGQGTTVQIGAGSPRLEKDVTP